MPEMKTLNGYEIVDAQAREDIEALKSAEVDLTGYATEKYVDDAIAGIEIPEATSTEGAYHLVFPEADYAVITDEKTIEYMNLVEAGKFACAYLTGYGVQSYGKDMAEYAIVYVEQDDSNKRSYYLYTGMSIKQAGDARVRPLHYYIISIWKNHSDEWTKSSIQEVTHNVATSTYVNDAIQTAIDELEIPEGGDGDLSNYYTKEETYSKAEVDEAIANIEIPEGGGDLSNYYTKEDIDAMFEGIATAEGGAY